MVDVTGALSLGKLHPPGILKESDFSHAVQLMQQKRRDAVKFPVDAGFMCGKPVVITWTLVPCCLLFHYVAYFHNFLDKFVYSIL
jgi:hypothetical protein